LRAAARGRSGLARERLLSDALLLRRTPYGEVDLVVHLFTAEAGSVAALARGARRSTRRFVALEPLHLLRVTVELVPGRELGTLIETELVRPRLALLGRLASMEAAGAALRWLRRLAPPRTPEPELWRETNQLLDALDSTDAAGAEALLGAAGLRMLALAGWGLELERCVRCGRACPPKARAIVDVRAGGIVCRNCGGVGITVTAAARAAMAAASRGDDAGLAPHAALCVRMVDQAIEAHGSGEAT
jgi:DNA repair protein RecO (recombination protein O)